MVITLESYRRGVADSVYNLYTITHLIEPETFACQDLPIALIVELCEPLAELELLAIYIDSSVGSLLALH